MKKLISYIITIALFLSTMPVGSVFAASLQALPTCSIPKWQVKYNGVNVSGGCTCHVAERVKSATGKDIPWKGNAGAWWDNSTWTKNTDEPRKGAIAAFSYGHVAYVESVVYKNKNTPTEIQTMNYTRDFVKYRATLYKVTETYTVLLSHKDYSRIIQGDNSVRFTTFESKVEKFYWQSENLKKLDWVRNRNFPLPGISKDKWTTSRTGNAKSLQGFIYP